jgi:hypothetical protein
MLTQKISKKNSKDTVNILKNCMNVICALTICFFLFQYYIHAKIEELLDHIPAKVLPKEWGGEEQSIESLARQWRHRVDELKDYLQNIKDLCNTTPAPIMDSDMYGTVGAFRKLDID